MYLTENFGWVFIYVFAFGVSDLLMNWIVKTDSARLGYYFAVGLVGFIMIFCKMKESSKNTKDGI